MRFLGAVEADELMSDTLRVAALPIQLKGLYAGSSFHFKVAGGVVL